MHATLAAQKHRTFVFRDSPAKNTLGRVRDASRFPQAPEGSRLWLILDLCSLCFPLSGTVLKKQSEFQGLFS